MDFASSNNPVLRYYAKTQGGMESVTPATKQDMASFASSNNPVLRHYAKMNAPKTKVVPSVPVSNTTPNSTRADGAGVGGEVPDIVMPRLEIKAFGAGDYGGDRVQKTTERIGKTVAAAATGAVGNFAEALGQVTTPQGLTIGEELRLAKEGKVTEADRQEAAKVKADRIRENIKEPLQSFSDRMAQKSATLTEEAKEGLGKVGQFAVDVGVTGTQLLGDMALGAINPVLGTASMATRVFGGSAQEARQAGATETQQQLYGLGNAAVSVLVEKIAQVGNLFKRAYGGSIAGGSVDDILTKVIGKVIKNPSARNIVGSAIGEGGEEALEAIVQPAMKAIYDEGATLNTTWFGNKEQLTDYLADVGYNALLGSTLGALGGGGNVTSPATTQTVQDGAQSVQEAQNGLAAGSETPAAQTGAQSRAEGVQRDARDALRFEDTVAAEIFGSNRPTREGFTSLENAVANQFERDTGIRIEDVESILGGLANGDYNSANWVARIARDAKDPKMVVVAHELTHHLQTLAPQEYERFRAAVADYITRSGGEDALADMMNRYRSAYGEAGQSLSDSAVMDEMAADFTQVLLEDADLFGRFARENRTLAERLLDALKELIAKIRANFTGREQDAAAQQATGRTMSELTEIAQQWQSVYDAAAAAYGQNANTATREGDGVTRYRLEANAYEGKSMTGNEEIYSYDFLSALPDMHVLTMPALNEVKTDGRIDRNKAVNMGLKNAKSVGRALPDGSAAVKNRYTGREIVVSKSGLEHGLDSGNGGNVSRLRTNARLSAIGGDIIANAVPINALTNKNRQAEGTYAMAALLESGDRDVVAIVTVEQHKGNVVGIDYVDITHAISGRLQKNKSTRSSTRETGYGLSAAPTTDASDIKVADFIDVVNSTYQSLLSEDVLSHFNAQKDPNGYYSGRTLYSLKSTAPLREMMAQMPQQMMIQMPRLTTVEQDMAEAAQAAAVAPAAETVEDTVRMPTLSLTDADAPVAEPLTAQDMAREMAWRGRMASEPAAPRVLGTVQMPRLSADIDEAGMGLADFTGNVEAAPEAVTAEIEQAMEDLYRTMEAPMETPTESAERDERQTLARSEGLVNTATEAERQTLREKAAESWSFFKRKMVDAGDAVTQVGKALGDTFLYPFYNMARASASAGANMIAEEQTDINGNPVGKSLNAIFDPIRAKGEDYYKRFQTYIYDLHNIARMSMDQRAKAAQQEAKAALANYTAEHPEFLNMTEAEVQRQTNDIDELKAEEAAEYMRLVRWVNRTNKMGNKPVFDWDMTAEMSRARAERLLREHPEFAQYREQVRKYIDNLMQYRVDSGLITQQDADFLRSYYPDYVPTYRQQAKEDFAAPTKRNKVKVGKTIGQARGGEEKLAPLHESLGKQTMQVVREGSKNRFGRRLLADYVENPNDPNVAKYIKHAEEYEPDFSIDTFDAPEDPSFRKGNTFAVYNAGKLYEMTVDDAMFEAVKALSPDAAESNTVTRVVRDINKLYKALITGYNPTFAIRNTVRDLQTAGLYSRDFAAWAKNWPKALAEIKNEGPMWKQYKALGGDFSSVFDYATGTVKRPATKAGKVMDKVQSLNMAMEQAPRLAEFMAVMEKGDGSMESAMDAMLAAADVTVNFGRSGSWGKWLNANYVPFLNPGIQGFDKMVRYATQSRSGKQWLMMATRAAALGIAPSLINALLYRDDEEWEELRDSDKDTNYMFKLRDGMWLKIPKGRELSVLGIAADRVSDALRGEEVDIMPALNTMANQVAPANPLNQNILKAAYDTALFDPTSPGRTWYGGDIEGQRLQNYAPGERYDSSTDIVSKAVGRALGLSPKKLNYLADQYTGVVGDLVLPMLTPQAERDMFSKAFTVDSVSSNELSGKFYDKADELKYAKNGGDATAAVVSRYWSKVSSEVSALYGEIRDVENNAALNNRQKKAQVQELQREINALQREALATVDQYTAAVKSSLFGEDDDAADFAYRETNREVFGAEYALEAYNKDVYAKAQEAAKSGVSYEAYYDYYFATKDIEGDKDNSGKTVPGSKREKVLAEINKMNLTVEQKNALYFANGYAESTLYEAPWYNIMPRL